jgi:hypothetical protein
VPAGTKLTVVSGNQTYSTNGQVISGLDIHGYVKITGKNVTLKDSIVRGPNSVSGCTDIGVITVTGGGSATIEDTEVDPTDPTACVDGTWSTNATWLRMNIHGSVDGMKAYDNTVLEDSYVHDLKQFASDPNQGGGATHNDAVQTFDANTNVSLIGNFFDVGKSDNSDFQLSQDFGQPAQNITVEGNWMYGGLCSLNMSSEGGPAITAANDILVENNRFGENTTTFDCPILISEDFVIKVLSGNVYDQNGEPIPPVQQHN